MSNCQPPVLHGVQAQRLGTQDPAGALWLPVCEECGTVSYPLRELCAHCLSDRLAWQPVGEAGTVLATTTIHHSNEPYFRPRLPLRIASVRLDAGPVLLVFLAQAALAEGARVRVRIRTEEGGAALLAASAEGADSA
jgi:uncharacterized OB-fold protein